jgi:signal transduction histidine kinase
LSNQAAQAGHCAKLLFIFLLGLVALNIIALLFLPFIMSGTPRYILLVVLLVLALLEFATLILYRRREQEQLRNLQEQNRQLTESDQFKERLLLIIDHELRTPSVP